eukprot:GHVP01008886.1.p1 GENE.GHVP01008886.1~~GHVP01008886.1.p1  ORF type:complete len:105 (-),score=6.12 GHVP01008886.1:560-874(-)
MTNEEVILQDNSQALVIDAAVDALVATYNDWASLSSEEITGVFDNVGMGFRCLLIFYGGVCRHFPSKNKRHALKREIARIPTLINPSVFSRPLVFRRFLARSFI